MSANHDKTTFVITRRFDRSRAAVWQAWTDPEQLKHWWGPKGCSIGIQRFEFRPGGFFHYVMKFDAAPPMWGRFNYREIVVPERIVWLNSFSNERCGIARAPFSDVCPLEIENAVTFAEHDGHTMITLRAQPFGEVDAERKYFEELHPSLEEGYGGTFEQLADHLENAMTGGLPRPG